MNNSSGSGTGNSDITVDTGTLGGNGFIVNTGDKGVTFNSHGVLSPGASAGAIGTLTLAMGTKGLSISAVANQGLGSLVFDLDTTSHSDLVSLTAGTLNVGTGLKLTDFTFNAGTLAAGDYVLFDTTNTITGYASIDTTTTAVIGGKTAHLGLLNGNQYLVLTVVPEPASLSVLALGGLALLGRRRR